ncbi:LuxR C-terminal-related transcriptional regulator [Streptomyces albidoflavus]
MDETAQAVYLRILGDPELRIRDLVVQLGLSESAVRSSLDELARMELLRSSVHEPDALQPVRPEVALHALLAREQTEVSLRQQRLAESRVAVEAWLAAQVDRRDDATPSVERLIGIDQIRDKLGQLAVSCQSEACSFMPGGAQSRASLDASRPLDEEAMVRGVRLRTVYQDSVRNDGATHEYAKWLHVRGGEVRTSPTLPLRMLVIDRRQALVPFANENSGAGALLLTGEGIATALMALFDSVWRDSVPFGLTPSRDEQGLSLQELRILQLLAQGCTDEVVARRMSVSVRTVRRVSSELSSRLGTQSRFQAGAKAFARGWLKPEDLEV